MKGEAGCFEKSEYLSECIEINKESDPGVGFFILKTLLLAGDHVEIKGAGAMGTVNHDKLNVCGFAGS